MNNKQFLKLAPKPSTQKVDFNYFAPQARSVYLAGTFNSWNENACLLKKTKDGHWKTSLPLETGRYEYLFFVDGSWECDSNARECVPNPFGSWNCVVTVA